MEKSELRKANGDVYFEAIRKPDNTYILVKWIGVQSLETVVMGCNHLLRMLREKPCRALLNSNQELIGPWEVAVPYMVSKWVPTACQLGLQYFAHVLSPGIFGKRSYEVFRRQIQEHLPQGKLRLSSFEEEEMAETWLLLHLN